MIQIIWHALLYFFAILLLRFAAISFACYILISLILILSVPSCPFLLRCFMILYLIVLFCHFIVKVFLFHLSAPFVPFFDLIFTLISHFSAWLIKCLRPVKILFSAIYRLFAVPTYLVGKRIQWPKIQFLVAL